MKRSEWEDDTWRITARYDARRLRAWAMRLDEEEAPLEKIDALLEAAEVLDWRGEEPWVD